MTAMRPAATGPAPAVTATPAERTTGAAPAVTAPPADRANGGTP
ncbi:hypothetical protein GA0070621_1402 [Micromonospora narathiwatensis]|uniref:Uncharacterized protein n=1 Tax=Micromonospora narathiwatensis TaxID=299146 RepID=A0A1A8ZE24_9ACTN|nr:hypothetical protein GA0070621_1402 [Micromonospora narathiwatensis]